MTTYHADIVGEDRTEFVASVEADSHSEARTYFEEMYPEGRIGGISTDEELRRLESSQHERWEREYMTGIYEYEEY